MTLHANDLEKFGSRLVTPTLRTRDLGHGFYRRHGKRIADVALVVLSLPVVLPLGLLFCLILMLTGHRPIYIQDRIGRDGRVFRIYKLRTMIRDADQRLEMHLARNSDARAEWALCQKLKHDPRITPLGRFLRATSLDELPQLLNVLKGDMALIGPRPMMIDQVPLYPGTLYYAMRPGISGPWQVSQRNESTFAARAEFDNDYFVKLSFGTDVRLILRTFLVVLRGTGC